MLARWFGRDGETSAPERRDVRRLFEAHLAASESGFLSRDFLHFPAGTPAGVVDKWFETVHAELNRDVEPKVEIVTRGLFRARRRTYEGMILDVGPGHVRLDGRPITELVGRTIVGVRWIVGQGTVNATADAPMRGMINGVMFGGTRRIKTAVASA